MIKSQDNFVISVLILWHGTADIIQLKLRIDSHGCVLMAEWAAVLMIGEFDLYFVGHL